MATKSAVAKTWNLKRNYDYTLDSRYPGGDKPDSYSLDFTALGANENPISRGGTWTNNTQGTDGNAAMTTNTSMQIRLSTNGLTRICCDASGPHVNYEDSMAWKPGFPGNQRVVATVYVAPGYAPTTNHELELYAGAVCYAADDKRCIQATVDKAGAWVLALHDGDTAAYDSEPTGGWIVIYSATLTGASVIADGEQMILELDRTAKTCKLWQGTTLRCSTQWATLHDEIDARAQTALNNLGDGAGLAMIRRGDAPADALEGSYGFRDFFVSQTLLG